MPIKLLSYEICIKNKIRQGNILFYKSTLDKKIILFIKNIFIFLKINLFY